MYFMSEETELHIYSMFDDLVCNYYEDIINNPRKVANMVGDLLPQYPKEQMYIQQAFQRGVFKSLLESRELDEVQQRNKIIRAKEIMVDTYGFQEEISAWIINLFSQAICLKPSEMIKSESSVQKKLSNLTELEEKMFRTKDLAEDLVSEIEGNTLFSSSEITAIVDHFDVESHSDLKVFLYEILLKLTEECLIEWIEYGTEEDSYSLVKTYFTKINRTGIALNIHTEYKEMGDYRITLYFSVQNRLNFKLSEKYSYSDIKMIKQLDSIYPLFAINEEIKEKKKRILDSYVHTLPVIEQYLFGLDDTREEIKERLSYDYRLLGKAEKNILFSLGDGSEHDHDAEESLITVLSGEKVITWHEFSVVKDSDGYEGTYLSKINNIGVMVVFSMIYKDEKTAILRAKYSFQRKNLYLGDEIKVTHVKVLRDAIRGSSDKFSLSKQMKEYIAEKTAALEAERIKAEELAKKKAEEERIAAIPHLDIYSIFIPQDIPGLKQRSLYELYFKNRKRFDEMIKKQEIIINSEAKYYFDNLNEKNMSISQKMYGVDNPIIAQLELHGKNGFRIPNGELQKALDNEFVKLKTGSLYSNSGWEYYEIVYVDKIIKSTKSTTKGGGTGKWKGYVDDTGEQPMNAKILREKFKSVYGNNESVRSVDIRNNPELNDAITFYSRKYNVKYDDALRIARGW